MVQSASGSSPSHAGVATGRRIYQLLRRQIDDGSLPAGAPVPSTRAMAAELGVSRTTVSAVYEQLAAEGFISTSGGRFSRVATLAAERHPGRAKSRPAPALAQGLSSFANRLMTADMPPLAAEHPLSIDFRYGAVAAQDFPALAWRRASQAELLKRRESHYYIAPEGDADLRRALQGYLRRARGIVCDVEQLLIVHGSQQGIDLCARLLLDADDSFVFEDPGYLMARLCFEATGARMLPIPVDASGLNTSALPDDSRCRLAYVTPSHQFPLGGVLPHRRRQQLLQWAQQRGAWIVEDDYDGEFRYGQHPVDAMQVTDTDGRVVYIGTFSKVLSPQLRLGYLVLPHSLVPVFRKAKRMSDRHAPVLDQRVLAALIDDGVYERHVRRMRREHEKRRAALLDTIARVLPTAQVAGAAAGLHIVLWLPTLRSHHEPALVAAARREGIGLYGVSPLYATAADATPPRSAGLVVGYGSLTVEQIVRGLTTLAAILDRLERRLRVCPLPGTTAARSNRCDGPDRSSAFPNPRSSAMNQTVIGYFDTRMQAQDAIDRLAAAGIPAGSASVYEEAQKDAATPTSQLAVRTEADNDPGLLGGIREFFDDVLGHSEERMNDYEAGVKRGGCVVKVSVSSDEQLERATDVLEEAGAADIDERKSQWR